MRKIVFATNNKHKLDEVRAILSKKIEVLSLSDIECNDELPETAETLKENALMKAQYVFDKFGIDCFADDTGLEIDALDGKPGVYSARYAGEENDSEKNMQKVLSEMMHIKERAARFRTAVVLIESGKTVSFEGIVNGKISGKKKGTTGFGYDPIFVPDNYDVSFAEMSAEEKNKISHRGKAIEKLASYLL